MKRVPAQLALLLLHRSGHPVTGSALRNWVHRGRIARYPDGYDLAEIVAYLDRRRATHTTRQAA